MEPWLPRASRDRGDPRRGLARRGRRARRRPRGRGPARDRRAVGDGPGRGRAARRRAGAADRLARRRAPRRGPVPAPRPDGLARRPPSGRSTRSSRRPPRSSARSRPPSTTPACPTCSSASSPIPLQPVDTPTDPEARRIAAAAARSTVPGHDPGLRRPGQRDGVPRRARLPRHQRPRRRGRDHGPGGHRRRHADADRRACSTPTLDLALLRVPSLQGPVLGSRPARPSAARLGAALGLRGRRPAGRPARRGRRLLRRDRPRHLRRGPRHPRDPRAARGGRARRLGRAAGARERHGRRARVRRVEDGSRGGLRAWRRRRRQPDRARHRQPRRRRRRGRASADPRAGGRAAASMAPGDDDADPAALDQLAADAWDAYPRAPPAVRHHPRRPPVRRPGPAGHPRGGRRRTAAARRAAGAPRRARDPPPGEARSPPSALREVLDGELVELDSGMLDWNVNPLDGLPTPLPRRRGLPAARDPRRTARRMVARWRAMGHATRRHAASLRASARRRAASPARAPVARIIDDPRRRARHAGRGVAAPRARSPGLATLDGWTPADRERSPATLRDAVAHEVRPAFAELPRDPRRRRSCPRPARRSAAGHRSTSRAARRPTAASSARTPRWTWTPARSTRSASREIERIDAELDDARRAASSARGRSPDGHRAPARRPRPRLRDPRRGLRRRPRRAGPRQRGDPGLVRPAPAGRLRGRADAAPTRRRHSTIAYYRQPAMDGSRPGPVLDQHVGAARPGRATRPRSSPTTSPSPGTTSRSRSRRSSTGLPAFRRNLGPTAYVEGWGLYTERLADEMGLYSGDLDRIGVLSFDAWRASRLVVDTGHPRPGLAARPGRRGSCSTTRPSARTTSRTRSTGTSSGRARRSPTRLGQLELLRLRARGEGAARGRLRHPRLPRRGAGRRAPSPLPTLRGVVDGWIGGRDRLGLSDAGGTPAIRTAAGTLATVLRNRDIRRPGAGAGRWASPRTGRVLVVALLVAYDVGGAGARRVRVAGPDGPRDARQPAHRTPGGSPAPERVLVWVNLVRCARRERRRVRDPRGRARPRVRGARARGPAPPPWCGRR